MLLYEPKDLLTYFYRPFRVMRSFKKKKFGMAGQCLMQFDCVAVVDHGVSLCCQQ